MQIPETTPMTPTPPVAKKIPKDVTVHNDPRIDNYFWLRGRENQDVIDYLNAENDYTEAMTAHTKELQETLYQEIKGRIKETDLSVPVKIDDYYYYSRTVEGQQYEINCRKKGSLDAEEEIILDENKLAEGKKYFRVGVFEVSPDHNLLAFAVDDNGSENYTLKFKDLSTGEMLPDEIAGIYYSMEWGNDNKTVFYNTLDEAHRPYKIWRHKLGDTGEDELVFHEPDDAYFVSLSKSKSKKYIYINLGSNNTSEVYFLEADNPVGSFTLFAERSEGVEYDLIHHSDSFYIMTNEDAINFKIMKTPVSAIQKENWSTVIEHRLETKLDGLDAFINHLVIYEKTNGLDNLRIRSLETGEEHYVTFDEKAYALWGNSNPDFNTSIVRYTYASMITPKTVYDYDMNTREKELKKQDEVLGGYDKSQYETYRLWATTDDGKKVPMSVVHKKGIEKNGKNPLFLYGYGSYGATIEAYFSYSRISLLDRGFIYVIVHPRGGGYLGRPWYEDGKMLHKRNTFTDFIACAEFLIDESYTKPEMLAINGGSAGGLLMGAVLNMAPELFDVAVAQVPFVDVVNTMLDESIPLTVIEFDEWGNPKDLEFYNYIKSYSPYDNIEGKDYPNILVTAGLNDPRVQYWEPAKWTAKLRDLKTDHNNLLLKTNMGAGHGGASGRYDYIKEVAFNYAFVIDKLGLNQ
ncbi:MAG: prolyl oligopeptidase family serine peptidase [Simkaniaceae bacterium]|nr:prolyl oligopeptidase family serine peptidase [Simkaniaceae bacterium]